MKSFISRISVVAILLFLGTGLFQATTANVSPATLEPVSCFADGLYKFQSVQVSVGPDKDVYNAGETINFSGVVINENNYPVVDGNIFVRIGKMNTNYLTEGQNTVAEVIAVSGISIDASSSLPVSFSWVVPNELGSGDYRADYSFSVGKKFNLGGLPFTNEIIIGFSDFKITGSQVTTFVLDRSATKVNGLKYNHIGAWPLIEQGEKIEFTQPIKNLSAKEIKVEVSYDLYFWDSLNEADKIESKKETVTVPAQSSVNLSYIVEESTVPVSYLRIQAITGETSSIVNIRVTSDVEQARINYPAITAFPLEKGQELTLFSCFHGMNKAVKDNKLVLTLSDRSGRLVANGEFKGDISTNMSAAMMNYTADQKYDFLTLSAKLFDDKGVIVDSYETNYDCSILKSDKCAKAISPIIIGFAILFVLVSVLGLFFFVKISQNPDWKKVGAPLFVILLAMSIVTLVFILLNASQVEAEIISDGGRTKSESRMESFSLNWAKPDDCRVLATGNVSMTYSATISNLGPLKIGESVSFSRSESCFFIGTGGNIDTPYCGNPQDYTFSVDQGSIINPNTFTLSKDNTSKTLTSSNPSVISCSGTNCTAQSPGTATLTVSFPVTPIRVSQSAFSTKRGISKTDTNDITLNSCTSGNNTVNVSGYSPSWTVSVSNDPGVVLTGWDACEAGKDRVSLKWTTIPSAVSYNLYRLGAQNNTFLTNRLPASAWYFDDAVLSNTWYNYGVKPVLSGGSEGAWSNPVYVKTEACNPPPPLTDEPGKPIVNFSGNPTSVAKGGSTTLTWSVTEGSVALNKDKKSIVSRVLSAFSINKAEAQNPSRFTAETTCAASTDWSGNKQLNGTEPQLNLVNDSYTYTLTCGNSTGTTTAAVTIVTTESGGGCDGCMSVKEGGLPPSHIIGAPGYCGGNVSLSWPPVPGASSYKILEGGVVSTTTSQTNIVITSLPDTDHTYIMHAYDSSGVQMPGIYTASPVTITSSEPCVDPSVECTVTLSSPSGPNTTLNSKTTWNVSSGMTGFGTMPKKWIFSGVNEGAGTEIVNPSISINHIFTTVGLKNISVLVATSSDNPTTFQECSNPATTTVTRSSGDIDER